MIGKYLRRLLHSLFSSKEKKAPKILLLLTCNIHGSRYHCCLDLVKAGKIYKKERLTLAREPDNEYDGYAIAVKNAAGDQLGYIPKNHNRVIAELMDQHCHINAVVVSVLKDAWEPVTIRLEWHG